MRGISELFRDSYKSGTFHIYFFVFLCLSKSDKWIKGKNTVLTELCDIIFLGLHSLQMYLYVTQTHP